MEKKRNRFFRCSIPGVGSPILYIRKERRMDIKVLGPGCPKCKQTEKVVMDALSEAGVAANVEKVTDVMQIAGYGVFGTPAVVIDGEVKSVGKIPKKEEVIKWITGK
jgi:small redox-active disulfide protein 2